MITSKVQTLLGKWSSLVEIGEDSAMDKAKNLSSGLHGRIKRASGCPVIFDFSVFNQQTSIQDALCEEIPPLASLIRSHPAIMDGHYWIREDFIELYFNHYRIVIQKLKRMVDKIGESQ